MIFFEKLKDGTIGRYSNSEDIAKKNGYFNEQNVVENEKDIIVAYNGKRYLKGTEPETPAEVIQQRQNAIRKEEIRTRLNKLSQDFVQVYLGAEFHDLEERKLEFKTLHNELRALLGKNPRKYNENEDTE